MVSSGGICPSVAIYLAVDDCFSELVLYKLTSACWYNVKHVTWSSLYQNITYSHHDIAENGSCGDKQQALTHSTSTLLDLIM